MARINVNSCDYKNPNHEGNGPKYYTGEVCIISGCQGVAGTKWSRLYCFEHNVERLERIHSIYNELVGSIANRIKKTMNLYGMSQKEIADRTGMFESQISKILNKKSNPTVETIAVLSEALEEKLL